MNNLMDKALQKLNGLVNGGCEYPEAEFKVMRDLDLSPSHVDQLRRLYVEQ